MSTKKLTGIKEIPDRLSSDKPISVPEKFDAVFASSNTGRLIINSDIPIDIIIRENYMDYINHQPGLSNDTE